MSTSGGIYIKTPCEGVQEFGTILFLHTGNNFVHVSHDGLHSNAFIPDMLAKYFVFEDGKRKETPYHELQPGVNVSSIF